MNKLSKLLLIIFSAIILLQGSTLLAQAVEDSTGADEIFELIGVEKPADWADLGRGEKQAFLTDHGAYAPEEGKYEGNVDLDRYFVELGVEQPEEWLSMTVQERVSFINDLESGDKMVKDLPQALPNVTSEDLKMENNVEIMEIKESAPQETSPVIVETKQDSSITTWLYGGVFVASLVGLIVLVMIYKKGNY
jgi:hypothetical protein